MSILQKLPSVPIQRLARFLAVIAIAMAAGHLAQTVAARKPAAKVMAAVSTPQNIVQLSAGNKPEPVVVKSAPAKPAEIVMVATSDAALEEAQGPVAVAATCPVDLALDAVPAALIGISLWAPCHAHERVVLRHAGLAVTARLAEDGSLTMSMPALETAARVEIMFADGKTVDQSLVVAEAASVRRFGVQWQGPDAFIVHGLENGADYGEIGDISPFNLKQPQGGSLVLMGDATVDVPLLAQVYTFPAVEDRSVEVVVEAAVTEATCGQDLLGETIASQKGEVQITELTLTMPDCSGVGDFLVLKNLASDTKIAAN